MPFRSPKMYSFIFGFQRRVWWPKCTPASSNSFIVISTANGPPHLVRCLQPGGRLCGPSPGRTSSCRHLAGHEFSSANRAGELSQLALAELEAFARTLLAILLTFAHARIA